MLEAPTRASALRRARDAPLSAHVAVLGLILVGLTLVVGWQAPFSADEGAAAAQARLLADGDGWSAPHPFPEADPTGDAFPLARSTRTPDGWAPLAKHPIYSLLLAGADRLGGVPAMVLLSVAGTVAAAAVAAALAARLDRSLAKPALWVTGMASPLVFDAHLLMAHTLAAAAAGGATLCALRAASSRRMGSLLAAGGLAGLAVLLRNEAVLHAMALGLAFGAVGTVRRVRGHLLTGAVVGAGGLAAMAIEPRLVSWLVPGAAEGALEAPAGELSFLAGRLLGVVVTWLLPSYGSLGIGEALLTGAVLAAVAGALVVRRRPEDEQGVILMALVGGAAATARLILDPEVVPGLLLAFPLLVMAGVVARRSALAGPSAPILAGTTLLFAGAVLATQYPTGGSGEWGGRYFALGLPTAIPVALLALRQAGTRLGPRARRAAGAGLAVVTLAISVSGIVALRSMHAGTDRVIEASAGTAREVGPAGDGGGPVVLTTEEALPRLAWDRLDGARWLRVEEDDLEQMLARLDALDVTDLTFVTRHEQRDLERLGDTYQVVTRVEPVAGSRWVVTHLDRS